jgi:hypothetical protein
MNHRPMNHRMIGLFGAFAIVVFYAATAAALVVPPTELIYMGDTTIEQVQIGYSGTNDENLEYWFAQNGITNEDGSAINPIADQLQHELFYTSVAREYEVEFLGIGRASYKSPFGVFTYTGDVTSDRFDPAGMVFHDPLFVQNMVPVNSTYTFNVAAETYFGFYLDSNGRYAGTGDEKYRLSTARKSNPKANSGRVPNRADYADGMDHALFFITNEGVTIAFEDIVGGGDADFEDLVVNLRATDGSDFVPTPEPGTFALMGLGLLGVVFTARRRRNR